MKDPDEMSDNELQKSYQRVRRRARDANLDAVLVELIQRGLET